MANSENDEAYVTLEMMKAAMDVAIKAGQDFEDFNKKYPDASYIAWRDRKYRLRKERKIPPHSKNVRVRTSSQGYQPDYTGKPEGVTPPQQGSSIHRVSLTPAPMKGEPPAIDIRELLGDEKARRTIAELRKENKALRETLLDNHEIASAIREGASKLPRISIAAPDMARTGGAKTTVILPLFDTHVGQLFHRKRGGGLGEYNLDLFVSRANTLTEDLLAEVRALKASRDVERLVVLFGGDLLDGRTIHPGHDHESAPMVEQLTVGPEVFARNVLAPLSAEFPCVDVFCMPGNHGRIGAKGEMDQVGDSLDLVFCNIVKVRCEGIKHMTWHPMETWFSHFNMYGYSYFSAHGDGFRSWSGTPVAGANKYKERLEGLINAPIDVLIMGHHHSPASWSQQFGHVSMMGSWVGTNSYSSSLGLGGPPVQKVLVADENSPVFSTYEFRLARHEKYVTAAPTIIERI